MSDTAEQLDLLPPEVAGLLQDTDLLRLRIADLEEQVEQQRRRAEAERQRRVEAETSRDDWITIAKGNGVQLGHTSHLVDPQAARRAAQREADYARRLLQERDRDILTLRQLAETMAHFARLVPKLPASIRALPHDVTMALYWAVVVENRHHEVLPRPKLPADQLAAIAKYHADWQAVLGRSAREVAGGSTSDGGE